MGIIFVKYLIPYMLNKMGYRHDPPLIRSIRIIIIEWFFIFLSIGLLFYLVNNLETNIVWGFFILIFFFSIITSFDFIFRPLLLSLQANLDTEVEITKWLRNACQLNYSVYSYQGNLINAYATGAVPYTNTIIIGQTLIDKLEDQSLNAITLHEAGHLSLNHLFYLFMINIISTSVFSIVLYYLYNMQITPDLLKIILLVSIAAVSSSLIFSIIPGYFMRYFEFQADKFSAQRIGNENYIKALLQLDEISGGRVSKGGITHPTLEKRIENIMGCH
ncbi:MAG TPA: M48 family metallopeptidase [Balneolales bacterium]|nr:M48 family metallopeptidase [Balneolales bacterium]